VRWIELLLPDGVSFPHRTWVCALLLITGGRGEL
jgi:hypothetical protein